MSKNKSTGVNVINVSDNGMKEPTLKKAKYSQDTITNFEDAELKGGLIPTILTDDKTGQFRYDTFQKYYSHFQVLFLPNVNRHSSSLPGSKTVNSCEPNTEGREPSIEENDKISSKDTASLFDSLDDIDKDSWCVENESSTTMASKSNAMDSSVTTIRTTNHLKTMKPQLFLSIDDDMKDTEEKRERRGYCSFIIQNKNTMRQVLPRLPISDLPISSENTGDGELLKMRYGPCIWFFFGRNHADDDDNDGNNDNSQKRRQEQRSLDGRPEHTDSVTHDGTWHFQLSGQKIWHLRPTKELLQMMKGGEKDHNDEKDDEKIDDDNHKGNGVVVECNEGDVLVINTRLWWHRTVIPPQPFKSWRGGKISVPSISYARDFYLSSSFSDEKKNSGDTTTASEEENTTISGNDVDKFCIPCEDDDDDEQQADDEKNSDDGSQSNNKRRMTNVDAMYAANDIEENTIVFTEKDMPDCEMHRSDDPNCMLVEDDGNGMGLIVSVRFIKAGEFLSIAESDDEDEGSYEEVEDDDGSLDDGSYE